MLFSLYTHGQNVLYIMMFLQLLCKFFTDSKVGIWKGFTTIFKIIKRSWSTVTMYVLNCSKCLWMVCYWCQQPKRSWIGLVAVHKLLWQVIGFFLPPSPYVVIFYLINGDKKSTFLDYYLPTSSCQQSLWTTPYWKTWFTMWLKS